MILPVKNYYSTQATTPPAVSGQTNKLIPVLDACLVDGWGSVSVTSIIVNANTAAITTAGNHALAVGDNIVISGAIEGVFNTEAFVKEVLSLTSFTIVLVTALTEATGTISVKIAPLGWEKVFSGTNLAVYRSTDVAGTRLYMRVDDSNALYAVANMYETMSDVNTGTGQSTTTYWFKSNTANATSHLWFLIGDSKRFYLFIEHRMDYPTLLVSYAFGDIITYKVGDAYHCMLIGNPNTDAGSVHYEHCFQYITVTPCSWGNHMQGLLLARSYTQLGSSVNFYKLTTVNTASWCQFGYRTNVSSVNQADNGIHLQQVYVIEATVRGYMPGIYASIESVGALFVNRTVLDINNKKYIPMKLLCTDTGQGLATGCVFVDITGPW